MSNAREAGTDLANYLVTLCRGHGLDDEGVLLLILTAAYGWAEASGLEPKKDPRKLFELAARTWDALSREQRITIVQEMKRLRDGSFSFQA